MAPAYPIMNLSCPECAKRGRSDGTGVHHQHGSGSVAVGDLLYDGKALPYGDKVIPYDDDYVQLNSSLQLAWTESLWPDVFTNTTTYKKGHVLMLSWEPSFDDLKVEAEVKALRAVFEDKFNFHVTTKHLERTEQRRTQNQINKIVAEWVYHYDGRKTLLVVYFAGHGRPTKDGRGLELAGKKSPSDLGDYADKVVWNRTEQCLLDLESDVLQIFDCCYAGTIEGRGSNSTTEFLAATNANSRTAPPGPASFTTALIWALEDLVQSKGRFTTSDLSQKITQAPNFPAEQKPILTKRGGSHFGEQQMIVLQPLGSSPLPSPTQPPCAIEEDSGHDVVTLKFVFAAKPDPSDIRKLGKGMNHLIQGNGLKINRIFFAGIQPKRNDYFYRAVNAFLACRRSGKNGTSTTTQNLIENLPEDMKECVREQISDSSELQMERKRKEFGTHATEAGLRKPKVARV